MSAKLIKKESKKVINTQKSSELQIDSEELSSKYGVPFIDLSNFDVEESVVKVLNEEICKKHTIFPISKIDSILVVAFADPSNIYAVDDVKLVSRCKVERMVADPAAIRGLIKRYFAKDEFKNVAQSANDYVRAEEGETPTIEQFDSVDDQEVTGVIKIVNKILSVAIETKASDIHIEPYEENIRVRYRIDGMLMEKVSIPISMKENLSSRLKIMSKLDISERRKPQDGRIRVKSGGRFVDFRVSVLPVVHGEKVVLRILDKSNLQVDLRKLGFEKDELDIFLDAISKPQGLVLVTGPTGSGKTTTLYSAISELNKPDVNISTAEDPVEFNLDGINQVNVTPKTGLTFAAALKSFLRQDPDIVLVGEIRDYGTAEVAFKAASTGHLVLSTLHTNDCPSTIIRLLDMGVQNFLVTSTVSVILAQRLLGRVCTNCAEPIKIEPSVLLDLGAKEEELDQYNIMEGRGCSECSGTGKKGRVGVYEIMFISTELKQAVMKGGTPVEVKRAAIKGGMRTLRQSALSKLKQGITTVQDVLLKTVPDNVGIE